jgi:hypothetical protein
MEEHALNVKRELRYARRKRSVAPKPGCSGDYAISVSGEERKMTRTLTLFLTILLFASVAAWAADNAAVVGQWDVVGTDDAGQTANWTLTVKDDGGKLGGTLSGDPGEFALVDAKLEGSAFTFKVVVNEATYTVETTIDGRKFDGKYKGPEATGTLKGTKHT